MKKQYFFPAILLACITIITGCGSSDDSTKPAPIESYDFSAILSQYVDNTVIKTYVEMKNNAQLMLTNVKAYKADVSQENLQKIADSWKLTRAPWEQSESFLYGPAKYNRLDPLLDSWPLDRAQLNQVLAGTQELTATFVRDGLGAVLRGFHTIEYLVFREGEVRNTNDVTQRERDYMTAVAEVLRDDCIKLWAFWNGVEEGSAEAKILADLGVEISLPYSKEFKNSGNVGSRYVSQLDAVDELLQGMVSIADEVANSKIGNPVASQDVLQVESWFSWNSLTDFKNNIWSIRNTYYGTRSGKASPNSLSSYIKTKKADLDAKIVAAIKAAHTSIDNIPEPFRNNLGNKAKIDAATGKINELKTILETELRPLIIR